MTKIYWNIKDLKPYKKNSRKHTDDDKARVMNQVQLLGQYKPLLITSDGVVLGGNLRLKVYEELKMDKAWVSVIEFIEKDGYWFANVNGDLAEKAFSTKESAMMEYALSDNDRAGYYVEDELADNISDLDIDESMFSIDLIESTPLNLLEGATPEVINEPSAPIQESKEIEMPEQEEVKVEKHSITVSSTDQDKLENLKNKLVELGFEVSE